LASLEFSFLKGDMFLGEEGITGFILGMFIGG